MHIQQPGSPTNHADLPRPQTTPGPALPPTAASRSFDRSTALIKTLQLLIAGALGMAALLALLPAAGHDQLWFLLMASRWLHGATLYGPEIFDSNTPAVVWLSSIPVLLAHHSPLSIPAAAKLCVTLLDASVALLCARILRRLLPSLTSPAKLLLLFTFITLAGILPARDFGQRDQLTSILCLPYLLAAALPIPGPLTLRSSAALLAAVGICLKPQQALVPLAIEATLLLRNLALPRHRLRSLLRRPEPAILLAFGCLFLAAIHHLAPLFFTLTLPTLLLTYWAIGHLTPLQLLAQAPELHFLALVTLALLPLVRRRNPSSSLIPPALLFSIAGVAATLAYYLQGTGWYYQQLPALVFFAAGLAFELLALTESRPLRLPRRLPASAAALVLLTLVLTTHFSGYPFTRDRAYNITSPDPTLFQNLPPGTPIATLTTSVDDAIMPVFRYGLTWSQRTNNLWTLPAILRSADPHPTDWQFPSRHRLSPANVAQLSARQRRWMGEDLTRWQPRLVLVARCQDPAVHCQELEDRHDDLLAFFLADPAFAHLWRTHYHLQRSAGAYDAYTLTLPFHTP